MVGIDQQRQLAGAVDAVGLRGELGQRQHDQVGHAEHGERGDGAGEHADLEPQLLGDARGDRIEDGTGMDALRGLQDGPEAFASIGPVHVRLLDAWIVW